MVCDFVTLCVKYICVGFGKGQKKMERRGEENVKVAVEKSAVLC